MAILVLVLLAVFLSSWVLWSVARELNQVRSSLGSLSGASTTERLHVAEHHLSEALAELKGVKSQIARYIPVTRQNIDAIAAVAERLMPVVRSGLKVVSALNSIEGTPLIEEGTIRTKALKTLGGPLSKQIADLAELRNALNDQLSGWLLPAVWNALENLSTRVSNLQSSATAARDALEMLDSLIGVRARRTYLVVLMNNAELRGSGGLPSSVGTLNFSNKRVELGRFYYVGDLRDTPPYKRVAAPRDFRRRWSRYGADTTLWSNLTMSPDVPDVAMVAGRLFRLETRREVDGVIFADPRGIAALMAESASVRVPGSTRELTRDEIPAFIYRDSYKELGGFSRNRRRAILTLGEHALRTVFRTSLESSREDLLRIGQAVAGGHLRFVPYDAEERAVMDRIGLTGDFAKPDIDSVLVTSQATAAHKLDFYVSRSLVHSCAIESSVASCKTSATFVNQVPTGLSRFVAPGRPYGSVKNFVEIYIPADGKLAAVEIDGERARFLRGQQDGHTSVGFDLKLVRGQSVTASVEYDLEIDESYSLDIRPQPLSRDSSVEVTLDVPADWVVSGPGDISNGGLRFSEPLDRLLHFEARQKARAGISAVWEGLAAFWNEPLF